MPRIRTEAVLAWLDERGWPHDPWELTKAQDREMREGLGICGHRTRQHVPCAKPGDGVGGRCKNAGGASLVGPLNPAWKDGSHSMLLPQGTSALAAERARDPLLLEMREDVALAELMRDRAITRLLQGDPANKLTQAAAEFSRLERALQADNPTELVGAMDGLRTALRSADQAAQEMTAAGGEAREWHELKRKTVETELKRQEKGRLWMAYEQATALGAALLEANVAEIQDTKALTREQQDDLLKRIGGRIARLYRARMGRTPAGIEPPDDDRD